MSKRHKGGLGDAPIEQRYYDDMNAIAGALDEVLNPGVKDKKKRHTGFVLLVFEYGTQGRCNFISNGADRRDIVALFKEMIARFDGQPEIEGNA